MCFSLKLLAKNKPFKAVPLRPPGPPGDFCSERDFNEKAEMTARGKTIT